ncbi:MAG: hypothetical protein HFG28_03470 [Eubacterium sp.]|jgi:leader peptidase (prepilin peptidase)/N-methyltransferase|nr:hypothetical protein [Eubacterium sp.]
MDKEIFGFIVSIIILFMIVIKDIQTHVISNKFVIILGLLYVSLRMIVGKEQNIYILFDGILIAIVMLFINIIFYGAFGGGDIKLMMTSGFLLGFKGSIKVFIITIILSSIVGGIQIIRKKKGLKDGIPLAPMISIGILWEYVNVYLLA